MSTLLALALLLGATPGAPAETFADRVLQGRLAEAAADGAAYQKKMWAQLDAPVTAALKGCIASHAPADKSPFTVVADISPAGAPSRVDAQPATPVATCFATWLAGTTLPVPPTSSGAAYPIEIDVSIVP
jgi:hypothetical protein